MTRLARALTKGSAVTLACEALFSAASATPVGTLLAIASFTGALWCWRYQQTLRGAR